MLEKMKKPISLLLLLAVMLSFAACGKEEDPEDDTALTIDPNQSTVSVKAADAVFSLGYDADVTLNPLNTTSEANYIVDCLVYEFAVDLDTDYNAQYNIITGWDTDNGYSWFFTVDTSITFHDGSKVTAEDVAYSIDRARKSDIYSARLNKIWGISALDEDTVMITLADINYLFPRLLNVPVIKKGSSSDQPEGTGQYMFNLDKTKLVKYEGHRNANNTPLDVIYLVENGNDDETIASYTASVIDLVVNDPTSISRLGFGSNNEIRHFYTTNMQYIGFNTQKEFTCYPNMRRAMNYAIDREYIAETVFNGSAQAATLAIPPWNSLYNNTLAKMYEFDLTEAQRIFTGEGVSDYDQDGMCEYQLPGGIAEIELDFVVCADNADKVKAAKRIVDDLASIGITAKLRQLSWTEYLNAIVYGEYDMFYGEIRLTADFSLIDMLSTNGVKNFYKYSDPNMYDTILKYLSSIGETERQQNCDTMCKYVADTAVIIPILFEEQQVLTHRDVVSGLTPTQYNIFYDFKNWTIDPKQALTEEELEEMEHLDEPAVTAKPQVTATPEPNDEPDASAEPSATPEPSVEPSVTPETSTEPTATPEPTASTEPTVTPSGQTSMNKPQEG